MVLGFNHNIRYKDELFHVQTEDSGRANPHIITLLYRGGTILASAKTSYADIIKVEQLEAVVESIMKEQHKQMMRRLKAGEFDARIWPSGAVLPESEEIPSAQSAPPKSAEPAAAKPATAPGPGTARPATAHEVSAARPAAPLAPSPAQAAVHHAHPAAKLAPPVQQPPAAPAKAAAPPNPPASPTKRSLDEVILDYLITGEEK